MIKKLSKIEQIGIIRNTFKPHLFSDVTSERGEEKQEKKTMKFEKEPKTEKEPEEIELCKKAIDLYLLGQQEFIGQEDTEKKKKYREYDAFQSAESLSTSSDGLRLGAPGWMHAKLRFAIPKGEEEEKFYVSPNGMNEDEFQKWQEFIGKKFEENGLGFHYLEKKK